MVHTLPPWTTKYRMVKIFGQIDSGELAARLGSIDTFDRRGNIVWMDDFEHTAAKWEMSSNDDNGSIAVNATRAWNGTQSMKLMTHTDANDQAWIFKYFHPVSSTKIGLDLRLWTESTDSFIVIYMYGYSGKRNYWARLKYNYDAQTLQYYKFGVGDTPLAINMLELSGYETWLPIKMVIDYSTYEYVRVIVADTEYNLSGEAMTSAAIVAPARIGIRIQIETTAAAAAACYIDDVILTQNEP